MTFACCECIYFRLYNFLRIYENGQFQGYSNSCLGYLGYYKSNFRAVHIFVDIQEMGNMRKYVQREKISAFTVLINHQASNTIQMENDNSF